VAKITWPQRHRGTQLKIQNSNLKIQTKFKSQNLELTQHPTLNIQNFLVMKKHILIITAFLFAIVNTYSQTSWLKYEGNPILGAGDPGSWDDEGVMGCSVIFDGEEYHMYYGGFDGAIYRIGHATSNDGIAWTRDPDNPIIDIGPPGSWEETVVYVPCVLIVNDTFHMWYDGAQGNTERIGHATSMDGSEWTKDPANPVMDVGPPGSWEDTQVFPMAGSVIFEDNTYKMWYGGCEGTNLWQVGYATSPDGTLWTKDDANNPVILPGASGEWDDAWVIPGSVIKSDDTYQIWFSGCTDDNRWRIGYATSDDGINWEKFDDNPVLDFGPTGSWDFLQAWNASVLFDENEEYYKMWYSGGYFVGGYLGYAMSVSVGLDDIKFLGDLHLSVQPNPSSGAAHLQYTIPRLRSGQVRETRDLKLEIFSLNGIKIKTLFTGIQQPDEHKMDIDLSNLPDGIYVIRLQAGDQAESAKIILLK
jgi:predicted GH43/DUF377 family glycosyl hydrolase